MVTDQQETYGLRNLVFDDILPTALEFYKYGQNPNAGVGPEGQNRVYAYHPDPVRTDDPNASALYGFQLEGWQLAGLGVAAALTAYLIMK